MALTENQYKQLLVLEVGGPNTLSALQLELAWLRHADKPTLELHYNYSLITAVDFLLGKYWKAYEIRTAAGQHLALDQPFEHLLKLKHDAQARIVVLEEGPDAPIASGVEFGQLEAEVPIPTPDGYYPDPNDIRYSGDPIWPARLWRQ